MVVGTIAEKGILASILAVLLLLLSFGIGVGCLVGALIMVQYFDLAAND